MADTEYFLDRSRLFGPIDFKTPLCVLKEILNAHGGNLDDANMSDPFRISIFLRDQIRSLQIVRIKKIDGLIPSSDYGLLARYINPKITEWTKSQIIRCFDFLYNFDPKKFRSKFDIGGISPARPEAYNACILYSICRYYHLRVNITTTMEEMGSIIMLSLTDRATLSSQMLDLISSLPTSQLVNILTMTRGEREHTTSVGRQVCPDNTATVHFSTCEHIKDDTLITHDSITEAYETFTDSSRLLSRVVARNNSEAVIIGAIVYGINLTSSKKPLEELHVLESVTGTGATETGSYIPVDADFRYTYLRNPRWYNVKENWTSSIPRVYSRERLKELAVREGYSESEIESNGATNILFLSRTTPNFYAGKHPSLPRDSMSMIGLEDIDSVDNDVVISYGIDTINRDIVFYRINELTQQFKQNLDFTNPAVPAEVFSHQAIRKLFSIVDRTLKNYTDGIIYDENYQLAITIKNIFLWKESSNGSKNLRHFFQRQSSQGQEAIRKYLTSAFELSMYMRGWKVSSDKFPLTGDQSDPRSRGQQIEKNVVEAIARFKAVRLETPIEFRSTLDHLKLMKLQKSSDGISYSTILDPDEGEHLVGRIKIVEINQEPRACIRISSNILVPTTYYYLLAINAAPEIDISQIDFIS